MKPEVRRMFDANFKVYGVRKVWRQMQWEAEERTILRHAG